MELTVIVKIHPLDLNANVKQDVLVTQSEDALARMNKLTCALLTSVELTQCAKWIAMEIHLAIVHHFILMEILT